MVLTGSSIETGQGLQVTTEPYSGNNAHVRAVMAALTRTGQALSGAYVHGSLATGEEIKYSDFDGLAIISAKASADPGTKRAILHKLRSLERIMFRFDPLQHHGWFVLEEADL